MRGIILKYIKFIIISIILLLSILFISILIYIYNQENVHISKQTKNYEYSIYYPIIHNSSINKKIRNFIVEEQETLLENNTSNKLKISYSVKKYKEVFTIIINSVQYKNKEIIKENNYVYNYNSTSYNEVKLSDYFDIKTEYQSYISERLYYYVLDCASRSSVNIDKDKLSHLVKLDNNYQNFFFDDEGLHVIIYLNQVSDSKFGKYEKVFTYKELKQYLKDNILNAVYINEEDTRKVRDISIYENQKLIAITFDDGPSSITTPRLLEELDKREAKATFFVLGSKAVLNSDLIKKMYLDGHDIGTHTYSHSNLKYLSDDEIYLEKDMSVNIIESITGEKPILLRPPYGSIDDRVKNIYPMKNILWNIDTLDWKTRSVQSIYDEIMREAEDGDIILLHDIYDTSVEAILMAIDSLRDSGFQFVTISEMLNLRGDTKDTYYKF